MAVHFGGLQFPSFSLSLNVVGTATPYKTANILLPRYLALGGADITLEILRMAQPYASKKSEDQFNIISGCLGGVTVLTSLSATSIIGYRVYSALKGNSRRRKQYRSIIDILVDSCAMYSVMVLGTVLCDFLDVSGSSFSWRTAIAGDYFATLTAFMAVRISWSCFPVR